MTKAAVRALAERLTGCIWWKMSRDENATSSIRGTYWFWDGTSGWHTSHKNNWQFGGSKFSPESMDNSRGFYIRCNDPRISPQLKRRRKPRR